MAPNTGKRIEMTPKLFHASFFAAVLLILHPLAGPAQINMQQMPNYSSGSPSPAATNRNRTDAPIPVPNSELKIVPEDFAKLKLGPGFLVRLNVLEDPDFVGDFRIDEQGNIAVPILGSLHIGGQTASEARAQITQRLLEEQILKDPQVTLTVLEYTAPQVTIIGEVTAPGKYPLLVPRKLVDILALAGGPTILAGDEVRITSSTAEIKPVVLHYSKATNPITVENVLVQPGDTVQVERAGIVYVLGAVNRPGGYVMQEDGKLSLLQAVSLANGTTFVASTSKVYVLHRNPDGTVINIELPYNKISRGKFADVQLHAADVLYMPTSKAKSAFMNYQAILAGAASASIYAGVVY